MRSKNSGKDFCIFGLPGMFWFFAVVIVPFLYGVYLTMTDWDGVATKKNFIGFTNFLEVVRDGQFWTSLLLMFQYVIIAVLLVNILAFAIAYLLTRGIRGQNFFRAEIREKCCMHWQSQCCSHCWRLCWRIISCAIKIRFPILRSL